MTHRTALACILIIGYAVVSACAPAAAQSKKCDPGIIYVALLENRAVKEFDKYWGDPSDFAKSTSYMLAFRLMHTTGIPVKVIDPGKSLFEGLGGQVDVDAVRAAVGDNPGCSVALGFIDEAVVDTSRSAKFPFGRKKYNIYSQVRLALVDLRSGTVKLNDPYLGTHETSHLPEELFNKDKRYIFPTDPVDAGGNALGVPFSRLFLDFAIKAAKVVKE